MDLLVKVFINALLIVGILECSKRSFLLGAILASLPITSILAMIWLYNETKDVTKVTELSQGIFLMLLPSLIFFVVFPVFIKKGLEFYPALSFSIVAMLVGYYLFKSLLKMGGLSI